MNDNFYELSIFFGIGIIVLEIWLIMKFVDLTKNVVDIKDIMNNIKEKLDKPNNDISRIPTMGDGIDENGKEYFEITKMNCSDPANFPLGSFKGYAKSESSDRDNQCVIAIYNTSQIKLGYAHADNKSLYDLIASKGNIAVIHGFIGKRVDRLLGISNLFYGYFYIV
jgi:hypothetical protein